MVGIEKNLIEQKILAGINLVTSNVCQYNQANGSSQALTDHPSNSHFPLFSINHHYTSLVVGTH
jgi:hypothetical protein